jgi:hypothetical protein
MLSLVTICSSDQPSFCYVDPAELHASSLPVLLALVHSYHLCSRVASCPGTSGTYA